MTAREYRMMRVALRNFPQGAVGSNHEPATGCDGDEDIDSKGRNQVVRKLDVIRWDDRIKAPAP